MLEMSRRERKKEATRLSIVQIAMDLFRAQGFTNTSMELIASKADIAKATLYKYFPVKEAIIAAYWKSNVQQKSDLIPQLLTSFATTKERLSAVFLSAAATFQQEPEFARIQFSYQFQEIGRNPESQQTRSGFERFLEEILNRGQELGDIRSDISASDMASQLLFLFTSTCLFWFSSPNSFLLEKRLNQTVTIFIEGALHD